MLMTQWNEDIISVEGAGTLYGLFAARVRRTPDTVAYRSYDSHARIWQDTTWRDMGRAVERWRSALSVEGLAPGDRVAIHSRNCKEWVMFDQAAMSLGLVVVPLYVDDRPENIAYILEDAAVSLLLVNEATHWKNIAPVCQQLEELQRVLLMNAPDGLSEQVSADKRIRLVTDWLEEGGGLPKVRVEDPHALASIVYTSGTTGRSKGVMLSHYNMLSVAHSALTMIDCYQEDLFLSFLPLSHTLERTAGYYLPIMAGATVAYARSVAQLAEDLLRIKPTVLIAVPRIFERVYGRIQGQLEKKPGPAHALFKLTVRIGWQRFLIGQQRMNWGVSQLCWPVLQRLVAGKITSRLGGRLRVAVSGGAPLPLTVAKTFIGLGVPILQGYGLTETSPVLSVNTLQDNDPASVGVALRGVDLRIGEDDELLARTPGMMLGYWNNHAATAEIIDRNGWLHTGDQARIEDGHVYITGRIKDILVLSNGEKVPPGDMETAIALDNRVDQCLVVGEGRSWLSAILVLNPDGWLGLAHRYGLDPYAPESLKDERLRSRMVARIREQLHHFPGYAKVRRVILTLEPWSVENGLLTPTLKVKRLPVLKRFSVDIDEIYGSGPA